MRPEFLDKLVAMGYAQYRRVSIGLGSHLNLNATNGTTIAITNIEVLPWMGISNTTGINPDTWGAVTGVSEDAAQYYAPTECQMRLWVDNTTIHDYTMRADIKLDGQLIAQTLGNLFGFMRGLQIPKQSFDTLIFANKRVQFSMIQLSLKGSDVTADAFPANLFYSYDLNAVLGIPSTSADQINGLFAFEPNNLYFPTTTNEFNPTYLDSKLAPGQLRNNFLQYPMYDVLAAKANNPYWQGTINPQLQAAELTNLPILNVEYCEIQTGNNVTNGFFDDRIKKALGWL